MDKLRILYLAHRIPYPPNKGDKIRSFNEIKYLSKNHDIHLAALVDDPNDYQYGKKLEKYCSRICLDSIKKSQSKLTGFLLLPFKKSLSVGYFYSWKLQKKIDDLLRKNRYDAIICFSSPMAEYLFSSPFWPALNKGKTRLIMDFCDLDSDKWRQYADESPFPLSILYRLEWKLLLSYEVKINRFFDHSIFVSAQEADLLRQFNAEVNSIRIMPNGVDHAYFSPVHRLFTHDTQKAVGQIEKFNPPGEHNKPMLLFTGAMDYHANVDGVVWFCDHIFPRIQKKVPDVLFYIVGSNPTPAVRQLGRREGIVVTGFVEDIRPYYKSADVCVVPLRLARGIQNKLLESMAMAKPVVSTSKAAEGITARESQDVVIQDDPDRFAEIVCDLLNNKGKRTELGRSAREFVLQYYNWERNIQLLEKEALTSK